MTHEMMKSLVGEAWREANSCKGKVKWADVVNDGGATSKSQLSRV